MLTPQTLEEQELVDSLLSRYRATSEEYRWFWLSFIEGYQLALQQFEGRREELGIPPEVFDLIRKPPNA